MRFTETKLQGLFVIDPEPNEDERGFFARSFCKKEFAERGLCSEFVQCNISYSRKKGTMRGMHWQADPHWEIKLIRCTMGSVYDVALDIREGSPTYGQWEGFELTPRSRRMIYVPKGFAHGFLTLEDDSEVFYQMSEPYCAEAARGIRWDDPAFRIRWLIPAVVLSERDCQWPCWERTGGRRREFIAP